jgi:SAM-dependent methyltransferase
VNNSADQRTTSRRTDADEIAHYDAGSRTDESLAALREKIATAQAQVEGGLLPLEAWLDTRFDSVAQMEAIGHVLPAIRGARVVQLGGTGLAALKSLVAGASEAVLVTPSQGELDLTAQVAAEVGLSGRLTTLCAFAEELPLADASVDVVVSEASMHHTEFVRAMSEVRRVLRRGGRFGCFEPWRAPLYGVGTAVLGKRDPGVHCRPIDRSRVLGLSDVFPESRITWHGALTRYLLIAMSKFKVPVSRQFAHSLTRVDDWLARRVPGLQGFGSSVSIVATKATPDMPIGGSRA